MKKKHMVMIGAALTVAGLLFYLAGVGLQKGPGGPQHPGAGYRWEDRPQRRNWVLASYNSTLLCIGERCRR